jgi:hypothetical protein
MIKYALVCEHDHSWDAWFASISGYDDQQNRGLVECPFCASKVVRKAPMAPSIVMARPEVGQREASIEQTAEATLPVIAETPDLSVPAPLRAFMEEVKKKISQSHDYVGDSFAREVRAMHDGDIEERPIYGEATPQEVKALIEDDIPVLPLPDMMSPKGGTKIN